MKKLFFSTLGNIASLIPISYWSSVTNFKIICPFYHTIEPLNPEMIQGLYKPVSKKQFQNDIDFLLKHFKPITAKDLYKNLVEKKHIKKPSFYLSFDDGLREVYEIAFPILKQKGITATVFINTDFVNNNDLFYRYKVSLIINSIQKQPQLEKLIGNIINDFTNIKFNNIFDALLKLNSSNIQIIDRLLLVCGIDLKAFLKKNSPYLTWEELKILKENGWEIGSHGTNHIAFQELNIEERIEQLKQSNQIIEKNIPQSLRLFAFPFTDYQIKKDFIHYIFSENLVDLVFGGAGLYKEHNIKHIQRIPIEKSYIKNAKHAIYSEYFYYFVKLLVGKKFIKR